MQRALIGIGAAVLCTALAWPAAAQQAAAGVPDFNGAWARYGGFSRTGVDPKLAAPPATKMELKPEYAKPYAARRAKEEESDKSGEPIAGAGVDCLPYGMPEMMSAIYPLEILQTSTQVTIIAEAMSQVRRIYLDRKQGAIADYPPGYYGHSVGHFEGDTLVVDTVGVKDTVVGHNEMPHSDQMRITERIRKVSPDVLHDEITVEDPVTLTKPWTFTFAYHRLPNYEMLEYVCENNHEYIDDKGVTHFRLHDVTPAQQ
jgi:hypothetical protein